MNALLDGGHARNLLAHVAADGLRLHAHLVGLLAADAVPLAGLVMRLAGAGIEAAFIAGLFPLVALLAGDANLLADGFLALLVHGLHHADLLADFLDAVLVAGLHDVFVGRAANVPHDGLLDRLADDHFTNMLLLDLLADRLLAFANVLLADLLANLMAGLVAVLFVNGLADGDAAVLVARLGDALADRVRAFFPAGRVDRLAAGLVDGLVDRLVAGLVASLALIAVAGLADLLHDGFLHRLVAGVPTCLEHVVIDKLVARLALLCTAGEAGLCFAAGLRSLNSYRRRSSQRPRDGQLRAGLRPRPATGLPSASS